MVERLPKAIRSQMGVKSREVPCPICIEILRGRLDALVEHCSSRHGRMPTEAELYRFRTYLKKDFKSARYTTGLTKNPNEISGGLPSLGKKR